MVNPHQFRLIEVVLSELIKSEIIINIEKNDIVFTYNCVITIINVFH